MQFNQIRGFKISKGGFTLVESLVGVFVFMIVVLSVYGVYVSILEAVRFSRVKVAMVALANEQFEIARNLSYEDVGIVSGLPAGKIEHLQTVSRDGKDFSIETVVRNIDDPFDGTIGGSPNDLSPADYKLIELEISCTSCKNSQPVSFTTYIGPRGLETASTNGALFVQVFDSTGQPIQGADVHIENNAAVPVIIIDDSTANNGFLQIVDAPPGAEAYEITVSKTGYSSEQTYLTGSAENPNPVKPHATVVIQEVTQISFSIDRTSTLNISSVTETCSSVSNIAFSLEGSKTIGKDASDNDILKYSESLSTDGSGINNLSNLEWDTYNLELTDLNYDLIGTIPLLPFTLNPNTSQDIKLIVAAKDPRTLLVTVKDASTQLPLSGASTRLQGGTYDETLITGQGFLRQTDWSGGAGQADFINQNQYFDSDGNIEINIPAGELRLGQVFGEYVPSGYLISSTFDTGSASNFGQIIWQPQDQPPEAGADSVRFQIATNNDKTTWDFLGPDGTSGTFYTLADTNINSTHNGNRYIRYKIFLQTADVDYTPNIGDVAITFTSVCVPPGQVNFSELEEGNYTLTVSQSGYQDFSGTVAVSGSWQQQEVILTP